jgi:hypothetical protein
LHGLERILSIHLPIKHEHSARIEQTKTVTYADGCSVQEQFLTHEHLKSARNKICDVQQALRHQLQTKTFDSLALL